MSRFGFALWLALALACGTALAADEIRWAPDIPTARKAAAQFNVPLLIHFYGDNCLPCKTLETRVYSRPELIETLNKYFICVKVNASQNRQSAAEYQVHSWPTDVFVSPDGKTLYQGVCPQDLTSYLSTLQNVAIMNRDRNVMLAAQQPAAALGNSQPQAVAPNTYAATQGMTTPGPATQGMTAPGMQSSVQGGMPRPASEAPTSASLVNWSTPAAGPSSAPATGNQTAGAQQITGGPQITSGPQINSAPQAAYQTRDTSLPQHQSPLGALPDASRGPLQASQQPATTNRPVAGEQQHVAVPTSPQLNTSTPGGLPQQHVAARNQAPASPNAGRIGNPSGMSNMPTLSQPGARTTLASAPVSSDGRVQAQLVGNPYFKATTSDDATSPAVAPAEEQTTFEPRMSGAAPTADCADDCQPALEGYCPVALKTGGKWITGKAEFAVKHRGKTYWMSSQTAVQEFLQTPDSCSPVLSGFDPLIFLEEGKLVEGSIQHGLHEQVSGTYLLFSTAEAKQKYWKEFDRYTLALNTLLAKAGVK